MPDLEENIAEWRRQLSVAGIKAPIVLDELESHLREDVDRQLRLGMGTKQAFDKAVEDIGSGEKLKPEFAKVQALIRMRKREYLRRWSAIAATGFVYFALATVWLIGVRQGTMEITWAEIALAAGAMVPMIGLGWVGNSAAKYLPGGNQGVIILTALGVLLLVAAALRLSWGAITPANLVHTQIILLWSLSPLLGVGNCLSAWADNCVAKRRELEVSH